MNVAEINMRHAAIEDAGRRLEAVKVEYRVTRQDYEQRVIEIGNALLEIKSRTTSWKKKFKTFGFKFSCVTAYRYMACAKHPEVMAGCETIEEWATASVTIDRENDEVAKAREIRRKHRLAKRVAANPRPATNIDDNRRGPPINIAETLELLNQFICDEPACEAIRGKWRALYLLLTSPRLVQFLIRGKHGK